jgi:hypothetical protein
VKIQEKELLKNPENYICLFPATSFGIVVRRIGREKEIEKGLPSAVISVSWFKGFYLQDLKKFTNIRFV